MEEKHSVPCYNFVSITALHFYLEVCKRKLQLVHLQMNLNLFRLNNKYRKIRAVSKEKLIRTKQISACITVSTMPVNVGPSLNKIQRGEKKTKKKSKVKPEYFSYYTV